MPALLLARLRLAYATWPSPSEWLVALGVALAFAAVALALLRWDGGFAPRPSARPWSHAPLLVAAAFLSPALVEETLYRALLLPHPLERAPSAAWLGWAALSLALYVLAHPLVAWAWPWVRPFFWRPAFLAVVALLGLACTLLYALTGSVWPPVALHGLVVGLWKLAFGGPARHFGGFGRGR